MKISGISFFAVLLLMAMIGCAPSTQIEKSWKDPSNTKQLTDFKKILVVSFAKDETTRRELEDRICGYLKGRGVPSYSKTFSSTDGEAVARELVADGFDAAIVTRLVDKEKETSYVPGTTTGYYGGFGGYYGHGYGMYSSPGYYVEDKIYYHQCQVFDLTTQKLIWSAVTSMTNPSKLSKALDEYAMVLGDKMRQDGFLPKK